MESRDFIEFMKVKDRILAVQFSIDTKKFDSFRKPFVTNKYLTVIQWEELMRTLNRSLCKQLKLCEEEQMETKGEFVIDDSLQVNYLAKSKNESFIDYSKLNFPYNLNWMLLVTVSRHEQNNDKEQVVKSQKTPKKASLSQKSSNGGTTVTLSSELEYDPSPQIREIASRYTPSKTEGPNRRVLGSPEYCPQSTTKSQLTASTYKASRIDRGDVDFENVTKKTEIISKKNKDSNLNRELFGSSDDESPSIAKRKTKRSSKVASYEEEAIWQASQDADEEKVVRPKKRGLLETVVEEPEKRTRAPKKNLMENWLEKGHKTVEKTNSKSNKVKSNINTEGGATSKKQKTTKENKDPDMFDPESMEKMLTFVETAKLRQEQRAERKLELKDYEIKDCTDMTSDDLKKSIKAFAPTILELLDTGTMRNRRYNPVLLTQGKIFTEAQLEFALKEIEKQRPVSERGSKEDILTEIVLPELIMHLFCKKFNLSTQEAVDALDVQEEYNMLHLDSEPL